MTNKEIAYTLKWPIQDFPRRGMDLVGGAVDSQGSYILKIVYVKKKESGPLGGCVLGTPPLDPTMHWMMQVCL